MLTFINPLSDPLGSGYQVIQSMISIGSGGFFGKGLGNGTQTHLKFLPVRDSDFIVSVMGEELGFIAIATIIASLCFFVYWCFIYAQKIEKYHAVLDIPVLWTCLVQVLLRRVGWRVSRPEGVVVHSVNFVK